MAVAVPEDVQPITAPDQAQPDPTVGLDNVQEAFPTGASSPQDVSPITSMPHTPPQTGFGASDMNKIAAQQPPTSIADFYARGGLTNTARSAMQEIKSNQLMAKRKQVFQDLLRQGLQGAKRYRAEAIKSYGPGVDAYIPPEDQWVDPQTGQFKGVDWYGKAVLGSQKYKEQQIAQEKEKNTEEHRTKQTAQADTRIQQGQDRLDIAKDKKDLQEKSATHKQEVDDVRLNLAKINTALRSQKQTESTSMDLANLKTKIDSNKEKSVVAAKKAQSKAVLAEAMMKAGKDSKGNGPESPNFTAPVSQDDVDQLNTIADDLNVQAKEWAHSDSTYNELKTFLKTNPAKTPQNPPGTAKPIPPKGSPERNALIQQARQTAGNDPAKIKQWFIDNGYQQ